LKSPDSQEFPIVFVLKFLNGKISTHFVESEMTNKYLFSEKETGSRPRMSICNLLNGKPEL